MNKSIRLGVTSVNEFNCKRRTMLQVLYAQQEIKIPFTPNKFVYAGNFLHLILQRVFLRNFSNVEFFYHRKSKNIKDAILLSMEIELDSIKKIWMNNTGPWKYHRQEFSNSFDIITSQLHNLALMAESLVTINNNEITSLVIQDEFTVINRINHNFQIRGKIDLVAFSETGGLRIIEYKTGTPKLEDENQIKIYGEILYSSFPDQQINLELWYSKPKFDQIQKIDQKTIGGLLQEISNLYEKSQQLNNIKKLPEQDFTSKVCQFCKLCDFIDLLEFDT